MLLKPNGLLEVRIREYLHLTRALSLLLRLHARLFRDETRERLQVPSAIIVRWLFALPVKPLQCRKALDTEALAEVAVLVCVDFCNGDWGGGECCAEFLVYGCESLAVAAPGGKEFDEGGFAGVENDIVEVAGDQVEDLGGGGYKREDGGQRREDADHLGQR